MKFSRVAFYSSAAASIVAGFLSCTQQTAGTVITNEETIALTGKVVDADSHGIPNVIAKLDYAGISDTTDINGNYSIIATDSAVRERTGESTAQIDPNKDSISFYQGAEVVAVLKFSSWIDTLPDVIIRHRNIKCTFTDTLVDILRGEAVISIIGNSLIKYKSLDLWYDRGSHQLTGSAIFMYTDSIRYYSVYVNVFGPESILTARSPVKDSIPFPAGDLEFGPIDSRNAMPGALAGKDTLVSINDTVLLCGTVLKKSGAAIVSGEWDAGATGVFAKKNIDSGACRDTVIAPSRPDSNFICVFRVTDSVGTMTQDTVRVRVVRGAPYDVLAEAGTSTVYTGDTVILDASAADSFGRIVSWEWEAGNTGTFTKTSAGPAFKSVAPLSADPAYRCVLRVTDDDGNTALDTVTVSVRQAPPIISSITKVPTVSARLSKAVLDSLASAGFVVVQSEWLGPVLLAQRKTGPYPKRMTITVKGIVDPQHYVRSSDEWRMLSATQSRGNTTFDVCILSADIELVALNGLNTRIIGDVNGDGHHDRFAVLPDHAELWLGNASGTGVHNATAFKASGYAFGVVTEYYWGTFSSPGRNDLFHAVPNQPFVDIVTSDSAGSLAFARFTPSSNDVEQCGIGFYFAGDFNGDGYCDLFHLHGDTLHAGAWVWTNTKSGNPSSMFTILPRWYPWNTPDYYLQPERRYYTVGDFDGDGTDDIIHCPQVFNYYNVFFGQSVANEPFSVHSLLLPDGYSSGFATEQFICDFNGDGKDDLLHCVPGKTYIELWQGSGIRDQGKAFTYIGRF